MIGPSQAVIVSSGPDRRRALRHAREDLDAVEAHADRAGGDDLVAEQQRRLGVRASAPDASPPSSGSIGAAAESSRSTASVGKVNGSASRSAPAGARQLRHAR